MMDLKSILGLKDKLKSNPKTVPKHVAITAEGMKAWAAEHNTSFEEAVKLRNERIKEIITSNVEKNIPILSFYLLAMNTKRDENYPHKIASVMTLCRELESWDLIQKNKIKISVIGKWYDLASDLVQAIKDVIDKTKDHDSFFLNFYINYDGQEEIVDAAKILAKMVKMEKLDADNITRQTIKENIYNSYFIPPSLIIKTGKKHILTGFLLWDSPMAKIYFANENFPDFGKKEFERALE